MLINDHLTFGVEHSGANFCTENEKMQFDHVSKNFTIFKLRSIMSQASNNKQVSDFLNGKSEQTILLFNHFIKKFEEAGPVTIHAAKTMLGIANANKRIAWVTQLGKNFVHVVFPFKKTHPDNLCFQKIAQVPGDANQFNHHFRMYNVDDVNKEVMAFMKLAFDEKG